MKSPVNNLHDILPDLPELKDRRTLNSKIFDMGSQKRKFISTGKPIHFKNSKGEWEDINVTPEDRGDKLVVEKANFNLEVPKDKIGFKYSSGTGEEIEVNLGSLVGVSSALNINPEVDGGRVIWKDVRPDLDIYLRIRPRGVEFFKVLNSENAPTSFLWEFIEDPDNSLRVNSKHIGQDAQKRKIEMTKKKGAEDLETIPGKKCYTLQEEFTGRVAVVTDPKKRIKSWSASAVQYPVEMDMPDITEPIAAGAEDVCTTVGYSRYGTDAPVTFTSFRPAYNFLRGGYRYAHSVNGASNLSVKEYHIGLRFTTIALNQGVTIDDALLRVSKSSQSAAISPGQSYPFRVFGADVDDAATFTSPSNLAKDIARTDASTLVSATAGAGEFTIDVTGQVQEIVDRALWATGNDMAFGIIQDDINPCNIPAPTVSSDRRLYLHAYEGGGTAPVLEINFTEGAVGGTPIIIMIGM